MKHQSLFNFNWDLPLIAISARPKQFDYAVKNNLFGEFSGREIIMHLTYADYETKEYPPYIVFPVEFHVFDGRQLREVINMRCASPSVLISDRIVSLFIENHLSGWRTYPIILYDKKGLIIEGYQGFTITGRAGIIKEIKNNSKPGDDNKYYQCDVSTWDGSDFAWIKESTCTLCSRKVKDVIDKAKIRGFKITPLEESFRVV